MQFSDFENIKNSIFQIKNNNEFNTCALAVFRYQYAHNIIYQKYCNLLHCSVESIINYTEIPFLPIEFFKNHTIITGAFNPLIVFESSGTTGVNTSKHFIVDESVYIKSIFQNFTNTYGTPKELSILALLPSYKLESSLVYMVKKLIAESKYKQSGFYANIDELAEIIKHNQQQEIPTLLMGVSFALISFTEMYQFKFPELLVLETGGMKGQRKELTREELHRLLCKGFGVTTIHSEYGMTELLSQAYSKKQGLFTTPPWMNILIRDLHDPLAKLPANKRGGINIIDLANINSCSFIATQDLGIAYEDGTFEVLGRIDNSDIRGCNLLFNQ